RLAVDALKVQIAVVHAAIVEEPHMTPVALDDCDVVTWCNCDPHGIVKIAGRRERIELAAVSAKDGHGRVACVSDPQLLMLRIERDRVRPGKRPEIEMLIEDGDALVAEGLFCRHSGG